MQAAIACARGRGRGRGTAGARCQWHDISRRPVCSDRRLAPADTRRFSSTELLEGKFFGQTRWRRQPPLLPAADWLRPQPPPDRGPRACCSFSTFCSLHQPHASATTSLHSTTAMLLSLLPSARPSLQLPTNLPARLRLRLLLLLPPRHPPTCLLQSPPLCPPDCRRRLPTIVPPIRLEPWPEKNGHGSAEGHATGM